MSEQSDARMSEPYSYTCAHCGGTYKSDWTDEEADAEAEENFGPKTEDNPIWSKGEVVVCDTCYNQIMGMEVPQ